MNQQRVSYPYGSVPELIHDDRYPVPMPLRQDPPAPEQRNQPRLLPFIAYPLQVQTSDRDLEARLGPEAW